MKQQDFHKQEAIGTPEKEAELLVLLEKQIAENNALKSEVAELKERMAWLEKMAFGKKSEKTETVMENAEQLSLFDEAEKEASPAARSASTVTVSAHQCKKTSARTTSLQKIWMWKRLCMKRIRPATDAELKWS